MPNDTYADKDQLSDAFDGVDSLAHLTLIADPRATQAEFFVCTDTTTTAAALATNACRSVGTDTSATQPVGPSGTNETFQPGSFKAFDVLFDIPAADDNQNRNIAALVCAGAPSQDLQTNPGPGGSQQGAPVNCRFVVERNIELDDGSTNNSGQTPALGTTGREIPTGEITGICVNTDEAACRPQGSAGSGTGAGTYSAFPHGSVLPTTSFSLRFRTSSDVTAAGACLAVIPGPSNTNEDTNTTGDSSNNPGTCTVFPTTTVKTDVGTDGADNQATYNEYTARFPARPQGQATTNYDVAIFGDGEDTIGECGAPAFAGALGGGTGTDTTSGSTSLAGSTDVCVFDEHYAVFRAQVNSGLVLTFNNDDSTTPGPGTTTCGAPDTAETNRLGSTEIVTACLTDQNGNVIVNTTVTFESTGVGTLSCGGDQHGHGGTQATPIVGTAGDTQRCTDVTDANGQAFAFLSNGAELQNQGPTAGGRDRAPGDQTVTACVDRTATTSNPTGCGSADTPTSNEVVKTWITSPFDIELVFDDGNAATACETGDTFKLNQVGDIDTLLACVTDVNGNPVTTQNTGNTGETRNRYNIQIAFNNQTQNRVAFASSPPTETDEDGQAQVQIRAISEGSETICAFLNDNTGTNQAGNDDTACVTKTVEEGDEPAPGQPECNDGVDNDGDGDIDFPNDPGCTSETDNTESPNPDEEGPPVERGPCQGYNQNSRTNLPSGGAVIVGTDGNDILVGTDESDIICGLDGNDVIDAGGGDDQVVGNAGNDTIDGGGGKDTINGNQGDDTVNGQRKNDIIKGSKGDDTIRGNRGNDTLRGGGGQDTLQGGKHDDILRGGGGNDTLKGFTGNDILNGGGGTDVCNPGPGRDKVRNCER